MELGGFILAVVLTLIAVLIFVSVALLRSRKRAWARFARRHGLEYRDGAARIDVRGTVQGRPFRLFTPDDSSDTGELGIQEVQMELGLQGPLPPDTRISRVEGWVGTLDRMSQLPAAPTGDEEFDHKVLVQSRHTDQVRNYLTPDRRAVILKLISDSRADDAGVVGSRLFIQDREMVTSLERLEQRLKMMLSVAPALDTAQE